MEAIIEHVSDYERERGKPMPTLLHGALQTNVMFELKTKYGPQFRIASEVSLATQPDGSTPDVVAYPMAALDYKNNPSKQTDPPLLVVEIQSPSQSSKDMTDKLEPYFYFGVKSCWIVVPDFRGVFVYSDPFHYQFFHDTDQLQDATLGLSLDLKRIFE